MAGDNRPDRIGATSVAGSSNNSGVIGVVSDTHGLLRDEAFRALQGSEFIIHAGDVGSPEILTRLETLCPVTAVRGNIDTGAWADLLPPTALVEALSKRIYVIHDANDLDLDPAAAGIHVVISGHSHRPSSVEKDGVLYLNPGAAGPRRFRLPVTLARLHLHASPIQVEFIDLSLP
jgi:putative phosphoesterase